MIRKIKVLSLILSLLSIVVFVVLKLFILTPNIFTSVMPVFYWLWLILIIDVVWVFNLRNGFLLYAGLVFIVVGAVFNILGKFSVGEIILRLSMVVLLVGVLQILSEYKKTSGFHDK